MPLAPPEPPVKPTDPAKYLDVQRRELRSSAAFRNYTKQDIPTHWLQWEKAQHDIHAHPGRSGRPAQPQIPSPLSGAPRVPGTWSSPAIALPHPLQNQTECSVIVDKARKQKGLIFDPAKPRTTYRAQLARWTMLPRRAKVTPNLRRSCTLLAFGVEGGADMKSVGIRAAWIKHEAMYARAKECDEDAWTEDLDLGEISLYTHIHH